MKTIRFWVVSLMTILMVFGLTACSGEDKSFVDNEPIAVNGGGDLVMGINVTLSDFTSADAETRTTYSDIDGGMKVTWAQGDTIGIFPNEGGQVEFPIQAGTESNQAEFDGGGWALKSNSTYAAYYPYYYKNSIFGNQRIQLNYTGQTQTTNGSTSHLGQYDYQATGGVQTNSDGYLNFQFKHLGALMAFHLTVPKAGTYKSLTLTSSEKVFVTKAELDISGDESVLKPTETSDTFTLILDDVELESDNSELIAYMMIAPVDLSQGSLELLLKGTTTYTTTLKGHLLEVGKQYIISSSFGIDTSPIIDFADPNVKAICVENFDLNNDGELSMSEAEAVTEIPTKYYNPRYYSVFANPSLRNSNILYFNELRFFTSLKEIPEYMFYGQDRLIEVTLPESITEIKKEAFSGCYNLTKINIPNSVTALWNDAFANCCSLACVVLPDGMTTNANGVFRGCSSLTSIVFPNSMTYINDYAFEDCSSLRNIDIPSSVTFIGSYAFYGCTSLVSIEIPDSVTTIWKYAFSGCSSLACIEIPNSVTTIYINSFGGCLNLTNFIIKNDYPPVIQTSYGVTGEERILFSKNYIPTIYVPAGSVDRYKNHIHWKQYADYIQAIPD